MPTGPPPRMHTSYLSRSMRMGVQRAGDVDSTSSIARGDVHAAEGGRSHPSASRSPVNM